MASRTACTHPSNEPSARNPVANARIAYGAEDGSWEVAIFGDNLTDEEYRVYAFDSSLFAGVVAGVYGKPRTYGVTATFRFGAAHD